MLLDNIVSCLECDKWHIQPLPVHSTELITQNIFLNFLSHISQENLNNSVEMVSSFNIKVYVRVILDQVIHSLWVGGEVEFWEGENKSKKQTIKLTYL